MAGAGWEAGRKEKKMDRAKIVLVTKEDGLIKYNEYVIEMLRQSEQIECIAADHFDLYLCTSGAEKLRRAVVTGKVYVGKEVPDGRYISAMGDEVYVLGGKVASRERFVEAKLGKQALRLNDTELRDLLDPWTW